MNTVTIGQIRDFLQTEKEKPKPSPAKRIINFILSFAPTLILFFMLAYSAYITRQEINIMKEYVRTSQAEILELRKQNLELIKTGVGMAKCFEILKQDKEYTMQVLGLRKEVFNEEFINKNHGK